VKTKLWEDDMVSVLLTLGFGIGLLILLLIYGKRIGRFVNMRLRRKSYYTPYYMHKKTYKRNKTEFILTWVAVALIILGILAMLGVFS
jgi:hypothetical protein